MWQVFRKKSSQPPAKVAPGSTAIWLTRELVDESARFLRESGCGRDHEGVVYWAGRRVSGDVFVTTCIAPAAQTTWGSFDTAAAANAKVVMYLAEARLELLGQVHSHPGSLVGHSPGDDEGALMPYEGYLSVVVPNYARYGMLPLATCGIHLFRRGRFERLPEHEVSALFHVVDQARDLRSQ